MTPALTSFCRAISLQNRDGSFSLIIFKTSVFPADFQHAPTIITNVQKQHVFFIAIKE